MSLVILSFPLILPLYFAFIIWMLQLMQVEAFGILQRYSALCYALLLVIFVTGLAIQPGWTIQPARLFQQPSWLLLVMALLALAIGFGLFKAEGWLISRLSAAKAQRQAQAHLTVQRQSAKWWMIPVTLLIVVIEELIWRAYLPTAIRSEWAINGLVAGIIASVAFGLHHLFYGWIHVLLKTVYGLIWLLSYQISEVLLVPVLSHLAFNLAVCYCSDRPVALSSRSLKKAV